MGALDEVYADVKTESVKQFRGILPSLGLQQTPYVAYDPSSSGCTTTTRSSTPKSQRTRRGIPSRDGPWQGLLNFPYSDCTNVPGRA